VPGRYQVHLFCLFLKWRLPVKKTLIRSILVLAMILSIFFTPPIHAADSTKIPFDYLTSEEQTFVSNVRAYILIARTRVETAQTNLDTVVLQDWSAWRSGMVADLNALNSSLQDLSNINPPEYFIPIGNQLKGLGRIKTEYFDVMVVISADFIEFALTLNAMNDSLKRAGAALDNLSQNLEKTIRDVAKQRERNEQVAGEILNSCLGEPGPS
jgi:hypothetical protein